MMYEMAESLIDAIFEALLISKRCTKKNEERKFKLIIVEATCQNDVSI